MPTTSHSVFLLSRRPLAAAFAAAALTAPALAAPAILAPLGESPVPAASAQIPEGLTPEAVQSMLATPVSVAAGQTSTVSLPVPVEASYSGGGWSVSASGGSATITAPAEGGQVSIPVSYQGYSGTVTLVSTAPENADVGGTGNGGGNGASGNGSGGEGTQGENGGDGSTGAGGSEGGRGTAEGTNGGAAGDATSGEADANLPVVPGEKPARSAASPADATAAEHIYLESTIKDNVITAQMGVSQAVDLYNRFKDMDRNSVTLRYIDADGNIIEGVQRDINATARTLTLTYPEGQAPDNPFIMQLIREDGSGVVADVTLRDPHYASADHATREQLEKEQTAHDSADSSNTKLIVAGVVIVVLIVALIAALVALARKRRSAH
ncbi:hypothetical protein NQ042_00060 [Corynebacterium phoceense]|uniref:hypothetical protein n=1 Tax=Corynebacterium phoceense TaxID=1686286 RepID=UPI00211BA453|nr:hypothetical protein [Corynebacterium phoceense]